MNTTLPESNLYTVYTDASHNDFKEIAVSGYFVFKNGKPYKKTLYIIDSNKETTTEAEMWSIWLFFRDAVDFLDANDKIKIYTDQKPLVLYLIKLKKFKWKWINIQYPIKNIFRKILNEIKELEQCDVEIEISYVKSHSNRDENGRRHNHIDQLCRLHLKKFVI